MRSRYRIRVAGAPSSRMAWIFGDLAIVADTDTEGRPVTTLEGDIRDQAALLGVLSALDSWDHVLISVQRLDEPENVQDNSNHCPVRSCE